MDLYVLARRMQAFQFPPAPGVVVGSRMEDQQLIFLKLLVITHVQMVIRRILPMVFVSLTQADTRMTHVQPAHITITLSSGA